MARYFMGASPMARFSQSRRQGEAIMQFYFDYVSPNAYLAWTQIPRLLAGHDLRVEPVPVLFSALLDAHRNRGPAEVPAKMQWMVRNIHRKAKQLDVPLNAPVSHPFNPLLALRVSSLPNLGDRKSALVTAIFEAAWVRHLDVSEPSALVEILDGVGLDGDSLIEQAQSSEIKALLRERTAAAADTGIFGVPTMLVGEHLFWGLDDFVYLDAFLNDQDLLCATAVEAWSAVRPSARRNNVS